MTNLISRVMQAGGVLFLVVALVGAAVLEPSAGVDVAKWAYMIGAGLVFAYVVLNSRRGGVSLMIAFFFFFFIAVPAFFQIRAGVYPFNSSYVPSELVHGYVILAVAQLTYLLVEGLIDASNTSVRTGVGNRMDAQYLRNAAFVLLVPSAIIAAWLGPRLFLNRGERGFEAATSDASWLPVLFVGRSLSLLAALICVMLLIGDRGSRRRGRFLLLSAMVFVVFLALNYPPGLSRFQLLGSVIAIAAVTVSFFRGRIKVLFALGAPLFLFFMFPAIKALGRGEEVDLAEAVRTDVSNYILRVDFDGFKQIVDTWLYVESPVGELRYGENFLGAALFWVPRALWPGKPKDSGGMVSESLGYRYTNVSNPLPAEAYISFGIIGVVAISGIAGLIVARLERKVQQAETQGLLCTETLLLALSMGFATIILRGSLNATAPMFLTAFVGYGILVALMPRRGTSRLEHRPRHSRGLELAHAGTQRRSSSRQRRAAIRIGQ